MTNIIVDRMAETTKTAETGREIIQMSMKFWSQELAKKIKLQWDGKPPVACV